MIKDIAVHLTGSNEDEARLAHAVPLAQAFGAHLTGLHVHLWPEFFSGGTTATRPIMPQIMAESRKQAELDRERLVAHFATLDVENSFEHIEVFTSDAGRVLAKICRTYDVFVGTRPYGDPAGREHIEEEVLFGSGRACLFLPPKDARPRPLGRVLIAWKNSIEAARAISQALPILQKAQGVVIGVVGNDEDVPEGAVRPGDQLLRHLGRHGVAVERRQLGDGDAGQLLLEEADRWGADLIVMGGYGNSRLREWLLGGVTRHILSESRVPVFMAH